MAPNHDVQHCSCPSKTFTHALKRTFANACVNVRVNACATCVCKKHYMEHVMLRDTRLRDARLYALLRARLRTRVQAEIDRQTDSRAHEYIHVQDIYTRVHIQDIYTRIHPYTRHIYTPYTRHIYTYQERDTCTRIHPQGWDVG